MSEEITPNITLGILGGGQLGRMSAQAAASLGIRTIILTPEEDSPASQIADETIIAAYNDKEALQKFANTCDYITYEFENIPVETVRALKKTKSVFPDDNLLEVTQDRIAEKQFLNDIDIPTTRWAPAYSPDDIQSVLESWNTSKCILKTTRFGYDGKGQSTYDISDSTQETWDTLSAPVLIIEDIIDFDYEVSVIVARDKNGNTETYGPVLNEHKNHILDRTTAPAPMDDILAQEAIKIAVHLADQVNLQGVLALELFITKDGRILANEIAPRTHNSGHYSIDACAASQFENHVRCACDLPVAPADQHTNAVMLNLIGDDVNDLGEYENDPNATIHLYGKKDARPGRKMGHITILK